MIEKLTRDIYIWKSKTIKIDWSDVLQNNNHISDSNWNEANKSKTISQKSYQSNTCESPEIVTSNLVTVKKLLEHFTKKNCEKQIKRSLELKN